MRPKPVVRIAGYVLLALAFVGFMVPFLWLLQLSLKTQLDAFAYPPRFIFTPTLQNFVSLWSESEFAKFFLNSLIVSTMTTLVALLLGVPAAYALVRLGSRTGRAILVWILFTRMLPAMVFVIPFFIAYSRFQMIDTLAGLVIANLALDLPVVIWLMRSFFLDLEQSLEEAAFIDGATPFQAFARVSLPLALPGLVATGIFVFILSWNEFIFALVLTRHEAVTAPIAIVNFMKYAGTEWGQLSAGALVVVAPAVLFAIFANRYLAKGLVGGSVKG